MIIALPKHISPTRKAPSPTVLVLSISSLAALLLCAPTASAAVLAYDGFNIGTDYTSGDLAGQNPTISGFTGGWNGFGSLAVNVDNALTYPGVTTDNTGGVDSVGNGRVSRNLTNPFSAATAGTFYLGFLTSVPDFSTQYRSLEMHVGGFDDSQRTFQAGYNSDISTTDWGIRVNNTTVATSGVSPVANETVLYVVKFELSATAASDSITFWVNPSDLSSEAGSGAGTTLSGLDFGADRMGVANFLSGSTGDGGKFDEVRLGTTFTDVTTAVPEPGSLAFIASGIVLLGMLRRSRRA